MTLQKLHHYQSGGKTDNQSCSIYQLETYKGVERLIVSTPESRTICNDPFVVGMQYTRSLQQACTNILKFLDDLKILNLQQAHTSVLHVLRGGLNFGLRESLADAYGWNQHSSHFISAQRARKVPDSEDWVITENSYKKLTLKKSNQIVFGDVLATGTSLEYALQRITESAVESSSQINNLIFFTIGGPRSHEIIAELTRDWKKIFPDYMGSTVIYLEGIFAVAKKDSPLSIAIDGTDLLRRDSILAPEFVESQYENPAYPLERCTIYDAGSRAFDCSHYFEDIKEYWQQTLSLAENGMTFEKLLEERMPEIDKSRFGNQDLRQICLKQLERCR